MNAQHGSRYVNQRVLKTILTLALVLPIATATVERFSTVKILKSDVCNWMNDENLSNSCIRYIKKDLLHNVSVDYVMRNFQKMITRRERI